MFACEIKQIINDTYMLSVFANKTYFRPIDTCQLWQVIEISLAMTIPDPVLVSWRELVSFPVKYQSLMGLRFLKVKDLLKGHSLHHHSMKIEKKI